MQCWRNAVRQDVNPSCLNVARQDHKPSCLAILSQGSVAILTILHFLQKLRIAWQNVRSIVGSIASTFMQDAWQGWGNPVGHPAWQGHSRVNPERQGWHKVEWQCCQSWIFLQKSRIAWQDWGSIARSIASTLLQVGNVAWEAPECSSFPMLLFLRPCFITW